MRPSFMGPSNPNTREQSDEAFAPGGLWERSGGPAQTRAFARAFHRHVRLPEERFTLLDVGCALGDALPVWHRAYPLARLQGCDVSPVAVRRATERFGSIASFFEASFEQLEGHWDYVFCSNVLEHFEGHLQIAELLLAHCRVLYVMTPFNELKDNSPIQPAPGEFHVATFWANSFDPLLRSGAAARIEAKVIPWIGDALPLLVKPRYRLWKLLGLIEADPLQIVYEITSSRPAPRREAQP